MCMLDLRAYSDAGRRYFPFLIPSPQGIFPAQGFVLLTESSAALKNWCLCCLEVEGITECPPGITILVLTWKQRLMTDENVISKAK